MKPIDNSGKTAPRVVRALWILVAITATLSLLYALQYYLGGPLRLSVVSEFHDMVVSPDKKLVAAAAQDGTIYLWEIPSRIKTALTLDFDVANQEPWTARTLTAAGSPVLDISFQPDTGHLVSTSTDGNVRLWDPTTGQPVQQFSASARPLRAAAVSDDGTTLAVLDQDGALHVWALATGQPLATIAPPVGGADSSLVVALSPDGGRVAAGVDSGIQVWDTQTGDPVQEFVGYCDDPAWTTEDACDDAEEDWLGHVKAITTLAFSPDAQILASGSADTTINFWDLASGEAVWSSEGHWATVTTMVWAPDGKSLISGGKDNKIRILRLPGGKSIATFEGHLNAVNGVAFGPKDDAIFSAGNDGTFRVWETANQYSVHIEWSKHGFQPIWGRGLALWLLLSGLIGLLCLWGLWRVKIWSHSLALALYLLGPIVIVGLPLFEVLSYPLTTAVKLRSALPLLLLAAWYLLLLVLLTRERVALYYEAPRTSTLSDQLVISQRTAKTRFGIYGLAVWIGLLVLLYSVLRRFNLDIAFMGHFLSFIMQGSWLTLRISAISIALAVILALLGALGRLSKNPIANGISGFYISLIRGTPLLVQIYIWYLGLPRLDIILPGELAGILALGVNYGAYMTEIFRAGIQAIGKGQYEAAEALGMSRGQVFRRIVLPQAFRIVIPPIGNQFIAMMKDSSLVSVMAIWELTYRAQKIGRQNFRNMETFIIAAAFYWILTVVFQFLQGKLEVYMARGDRS